MNRLIPHPLLSASLGLMWVVLTGTSLNALVLAVVLGLAIPLLTAAYWPGRPRLRRPWLLIPYTALVVWDVIVANVQVARIILFLPPDQIRSAWIEVPITLTAPEAQALLAGTITLTPGTMTADFSADGRSLLIHALHAPDPDAVCADIKSRYEARLQRIFG